MIDVRKPLKEEIKIKVKGGDHAKIMVKYERIPLFCYICGVIGHGNKGCDYHKGHFSPKKQFGSRLQASPWKVLPQNPEEGVKAGNYL